MQKSRSRTATESEMADMGLVQIDPSKQERLPDVSDRPEPCVGRMRRLRNDSTYLYAPRQSAASAGRPGAIGLWRRRRATSPEDGVSGRTVVWRPAKHSCGTRSPTCSGSDTAEAVDRASAMVVALQQRQGYARGS
jgi:hypothetical protein